MTASDPRAFEAASFNPPAGPTAPADWAGAYAAQLYAGSEAPVSGGQTQADYITYNPNNPTEVAHQWGRYIDYMGDMQSRSRNQQWYPGYGPGNGYYYPVRHGPSNGNGGYSGFYPPNVGSSQGNNQYRPNPYYQQNPYQSQYGNWNNPYQYQQNPYQSQYGNWGNPYQYQQNPYQSRYPTWQQYGPPTGAYGSANPDWPREAAVIRTMIGHSIREYDPRVPETLGCARFVSEALHRATGLPIADAGVDALEADLRRFHYVPVPLSQVQPGDVIIAHRHPGQPGHAAIYVGNGMVANNSSYQRRIAIDSVSKFNSRQYVSVVAYRRVG